MFDSLLHDKILKMFINKFLTGTLNSVKNCHLFKTFPTYVDELRMNKKSEYE